ncbi:MAG: ABC transporter substrate-binding protein [Verrucomicrobiota bacterium]
MRRLIPLFALVAAGFSLLVACRKESDTTVRKLGFDTFVPQYNSYIHKWLLEQQTHSKQETERITAALATAEGEAKALLEIQAEANRKDLEKWDFRLGLGDFLKFGNPSEVPTDLVWENGMDQPEMGDPNAKKGGVLRRHILDFPPTIRPTGPNSNNSFRGDLYELVDMKLITYHMETMKLIPGIAREWAVSKDKRTVYFRIDPEARYSDGLPVKARDYLITAYVYVSDNIVNPYPKQFYRENIAQVAMYDDLTLSISLPEANFFAPVTAGEIYPSSPKFYEEYGPDYAERYQWRFPPTAGAYEVKSDGLVKGVSITQTRVKNWWAKDRKYYKYRFNPDKIVNTVVRDESKAFELFRAGELDTYLITRPELWYEKSEMPPVYDGYIERSTFYKRYPRSPFGLYLNVTKPPLDNLDVRIGINHAMNWQKVIDVMFRGDYQRLNSFNDGYGTLGDPSIVARPYSIKLAREAFAKAGYTEEGADGILKKPDGTRLSAALTYPGLAIYDRMFSLLREDAKPCGMELRLDGLEPTVAYKKEMQKQHEIAFGAWNISPPAPDFHQFLHSTNAFDEKGNPKPNTNNTFVWARPDTDRLSEIVRTAGTEAELSDAVGKLQNIMHDEAIFVPGFTIDFVKVGYWRWVKWPDCENTRFSPPVTYEPHETYVLWIDEKVKEETQAARRSGKVFPEVIRTFDDYRIKKEEIVEPEVLPEPAAEPPTEPVMEDSDEP